MLIDASPAIAPSTGTQCMAAPARKRPLRTYGRRTNGAAQDTEPRHSAQSEEDTTYGKPASPCPEVDSDTIVVAMDGSESRSPSPSPSPPPKRPESSKPNRNSILSYFKPVSQSSPPPEIANESDDADDGLLSPVSSVGPTPAARKRRRLTTRPEIIYRQIPTGSSLEEDTEGVPDEKCDAPLKEKKRKLHDISPKGAHGAPFIAVTTPPDVFLQRNTSSRGSSSSDENEPPRHQQNSLCETSKSYLDKMDDDNSDQVPSSSLETIEDDATNKSSSSTIEENQRTTTKKKKKKQKELVQTTLSLAINPGPGFTICKDCGILYNHLNENDRKEHKRRHAAYVRGKQKSVS
ncbi:hypothetical protein V8F20_011385 [Naviculisporaceae sp. PSN 640]